MPVEYNFSIEYGEGIIYHIINNPVIIYDLVHTPNFKISSGDGFSLYIILRSLLQNSHLFELYVTELYQNNNKELLSLLEENPFPARITINEYNKVRGAIIQKFR